MADLSIIALDLSSDAEDAMLKGLSPWADAAWEMYQNKGGGCLGNEESFMKEEFCKFVKCWAMTQRYGTLLRDQDLPEHFDSPGSESKTAMFLWVQEECIDREILVRMILAGVEDAVTIQACGAVDRVKAELLLEVMMKFMLLMMN